MQDGRKAVWSIPYIVSVAFFPSLKHNFIAYRSSKCPHCIFEIHQLWQSGFSRVYSNYCCSCSFEHEIIKIGQSSYKMYSNNIVNSQESMTILNACTRKVWKLIEGTTYIYIYIYNIYIALLLYSCWFCLFYPLLFPFFLLPPPPFFYPLISYFFCFSSSIFFLLSLFLFLPPFDLKFFFMNNWNK